MHISAFSDESKKAKLFGNILKLFFSRLLGPFSLCRDLVATLI